MGRRKLIAGNWKLNKTIGESVELARELKNALASVRHSDIVVAPVYTALHSVAQALKDTNIGVSAQELFWEDSGAYTGAVSAPLVKDAGCQYVLVGHSERRQLFHETLETSRKRVGAALKAQLQPILCIGETLQEREANRTEAVVREQLEVGIADLSATQLRQIIIAYEPVWAIGTGKVATPEQAQQVHHFIRERLRHVDKAVSDELRLLYGGSVKADNAASLLQQPDIDGALVGGASLSAASFAGIVKAAG